MNKDYLFERTGTDAEIEKLESVLSVYRFEPSRAPILPENSPAHGFWSFGWLRFLIAAGAVAVAVVAGLLADGRIEKLLDPHAGRPEISDNVRPEFANPPSGVVTDPSAKGTETAIRDAKPFRIARRTTQPVAYRPTQRINQPIARTKPTVTLTKQEQYAYDQLRVALYITGSKLKVVQDTIDRVDEKKSDDARDEK